MRRIVWTMAFLMFAVISGVGGALPAHATIGPPQFYPNAGPPGTTVYASGGDYYGCESGTIRLTGWSRTLATANVGLYGDYGLLKFLVPADAPTGAALLQFTLDCGHSAAVPLVPFTVTNGSSATVCPRYLLGLHGMSQGPSSPTDYNTSPEIVAVQQAFDNASAANKKAEFINIPYPTTGGWELANPVTNRNILSDVATGVTALHSEIDTLSKASPCATFSLIGYSEGAWVIDLWLYEYGGLDTKNVTAIVTLGDPWWYQVHNGVPAIGLARQFGLAYASTPWPPSTDTPPYAFISLCNMRDPVCGEGYTDTTSQVADAILAGTPVGDSNPHHQYPAWGATTRAGQFLASR
jgi:Cutinase